MLAVPNVPGHHDDLVVDHGHRAPRPDREGEDYREEPPWQEDGAGFQCRDDEENRKAVADPDDPTRDTSISVTSRIRGNLLARPERLGCRLDSLALGATGV
jgi:hypothetical protein